MKTINNRKVYSISEINYFAKETLEQMTAWVEGEVVQLKKHPSFSFYYLTLKDEKASLPCVANGSLIEALSVDITNQKVIGFGNLTLYEPFGKYQLRLQQLEMAGEGDLYKELELLIKKLRTEGLFDSSFKKELPPYPKRIALVTSRGSDAWRDFTAHSVGKLPFLEVVDFDTRVQGSEAVKSITSTIQQVDDEKFDVIVITRGGGSIEDLAAFNSEAVARAIFKAKTPTVVAIGHEANESVAEWVADRRASTPTDAATIVTAGWQNVLEKLDALFVKLWAKKERLLDLNLERLDYTYTRLIQVKNTLAHYRQKLENFGHALEILSVQNTLNRGYSITTDSGGNIIRAANSVGVGNSIRVKLSKGSLESSVLKTNEK